MMHIAGDDSIAPSPTLGVLCTKRLQGSHDAADVGRVKAAVLQIWEQLEQEVSRVQASLPSGAALERYRCAVPSGSRCCCARAVFGAFRQGL